MNCLDFEVKKVKGHGNSETKYGQISTLGEWGISYKLLVEVSPNSQRQIQHYHYSTSHKMMT